MREILFRGRQKVGSKWFKGDLSRLVHSNGCTYVFPADGYKSPDWYEVDPSTVGQYTGLTDKNGAKIFEGDIVHVIAPNSNGNFEVKFKYGQFYVGINMPIAYVRDSCEVIGNIHDNQNLLKGGGTT